MSVCMSACICMRLSLYVSVSVCLCVCMSVYVCCQSGCVRGVVAVVTCTSSKSTKTASLVSVQRQPLWQYVRCAAISFSYLARQLSTRSRPLATNGI